jgi:hypothetical protein
MTPEIFASFERIIKLSRMADPANNASPTEQATAIRQIIVTAQKAMERDPSKAEQKAEQKQEWKGASVRAVWATFLDRKLERAEWQVIHDFVSTLGTLEVESAARYAISKGKGQADAWRFFYNMCRKKARET